MTNEENSKLITQIIEQTGAIVEQEGKYLKTLERLATTVLDLTERVIHLERMMGLRK